MLLVLVGRIGDAEAQAVVGINIPKESVLGVLVLQAATLYFQAIYQQAKYGFLKAAHRIFSILRFR